MIFNQRNGCLRFSPVVSHYCITKWAKHHSFKNIPQTHSLYHDHIVDTLLSKAVRLPWTSITLSHLDTHFQFVLIEEWQDMLQSWRTNDTLKLGKKIS